MHLSSRALPQILTIFCALTKSFASRPYFLGNHQNGIQRLMSLAPGHSEAHPYPCVTQWTLLSLPSQPVPYCKTPPYSSLDSWPSCPYPQTPLCNNDDWKRGENFPPFPAAPKQECAMSSFIRRIINCSSLSLLSSLLSSRLLPLLDNQTHRLINIFSVFSTDDHPRFWISIWGSRRIYTLQAQERDCCVRGRAFHMMAGLTYTENHAEQWLATFWIWH